MSRRPSVSIHNYPEDLNPFNDDATTTAATTTTTTAATTTSGTKQINVEAKNSVKEPKHKFWTFGRSKKKQRSNSFSIKSTWSGLFGKRKDSDEVEIRKPTIATVSSTYKRGTYNGYPLAPPRLSRDQQEFDEALGTLARRRKYTLDNSSRYSSTLTVNGDPGRIYEGSPQDTTASIMGDLTPKAPARRFGQVSPKPTDKIPPLDYSGKERTSNGNVILDERAPNRTPVPPKRGGPRSSTRSLAPVCPNDDISTRSADVSLRDENENVPEDYVFKRFSHEAIRKSNLSINSCVSIGSTASAYGRKKRRAPQPPRIKEPLETPNENDVRPSEQVKEINTELQIVEPIDIARVTENIDEMTKRSRELDDNFVPTCSARSNNNNNNDDYDDNVDVIATDKNQNQSIISSSSETSDKVARITNEEKVPKLRKNSKDGVIVKEVGENEQEEEEEASSSATTEKLCTNSSGRKTKVSETKQSIDGATKNNEEIVTDVGIELRRKTDEEKIETMRDIECYSSIEDLPLKRRQSSGNLSRRDSFSVKDEIEKIERQIKLLESINPREANDEIMAESCEDERAGTMRVSSSETRKNFFRDMARNDTVKVEHGELPRQQNDIRIVRIEDSPIAIDVPTETVKIIELHISEPIKQKSAVIIERDVNPIPKPRRHSNFDAEGKETRVKMRHEKENDEKRGNSL